MPHSQSQKSQVARRSQMNKADMMKTTPTSRPRDDLSSAYDGDENHGPAKNQKSKSTKGRKAKGRRLASDSTKTPIR